MFDIIHGQAHDIGRKTRAKDVARTADAVISRRMMGTGRKDVVT